MLYVLFVLLSLFEPNAGKRILGFFPFPGKSQHNIFAPILHGLAERGHQVVYLTPFKQATSHPNLDVRLSPNFLEKFHHEINLPEWGEKSIPVAGLVISNVVTALADDFYGNPAVQEIVHSSDKYDAVLVESTIYQEPVSALLHKFGCVAIEVSTLGDSSWLNELAGLPDNTAYQIDFKSEFTDSMSFFQRLYNTYATWSTVLTAYYHLWRMQTVMDQYFNYTGWESRPSIYRLVSNRSMILVNSDVALDYPYPKPPHMKEIGGVNILPNKPLPKDLQTFMDNSKFGVIYFSFGTHVNTTQFMEGEIGKSLIEVLGNLPQKVLMKWERQETTKLPPNIKTLKWIPQQDVLAHKNCVLFISHGGLLSLTETVYYGVPLVGIPFFFDQPKNMIYAESAGIGVKLTMQNLTKSSFSWAIKEVLGNPRYKEAVTMRSRILRERRYSGLEEAMYWIEHAMKYPNALTPKAVELNFWQMNLIDIKLFILLSLILLFTITCRIINIVNKHCFKTVKEKQS